MESKQGGERPDLSIVVATRNRSDALRSMLVSLDLSIQQAGAAVEVVLVDNGSTDDTPELVAAWCGEGTRRLPLSVPLRGKSRALNAALRVASAPLLAFTDDDVEVPPGWVPSVLAAFRDHPDMAAATGKVTLPPRTQEPSLLARIERYGTLPLFDAGGVICETKHLYGCNMAIRRATFDRVGDFNEQLGPGASGLHEDGDLGERIRAAGLRLAYVPEMEMHHTAEPSRLTDEFFLYLHRADARSRFLQRGSRGFAYAIRHWLGAASSRILWTVLRNPRRAMGARARMVSYAEYLRLVAKGGGA